MKAVMSGSFDPITLGHWDILARAARLFDHVIIGVGVNCGKQSLFTIQQRVDMVSQAIANLDNVSVAAMPGLLVDFCRDHGATVVVRGARSGGDFESEWAMSAVNASLGGVETVILPAAAAVSFVSSTLVRSVILAGGDASAYVPENVLMPLLKEQ